MNEQEGFKRLEHECFHWIVIKERKNRDRDKHVLEVISSFRKFAKEICMDNYIMAIDKLLTYYFRPLEFDILEDKVLQLEEQVLSLQDQLNKEQVTELKESEDIKTTF